MTLRRQHRSALRSFLLCLTIAFTVSTSSTAQTASTYDLQFQQFQAQFSQSESLPRQAVILNRAYALRDFVTDAAALDAWFSVLAARSDLAPEIRQEAVRFAATTARHLGNAAATPGPRSEQILSSALEVVQSNPNAADALEDLARLEVSVNPRQSLQHLETATRLAPTASRWLAVASECPDQFCRFSALQEAQRLATQNDFAGNDTRSVALALAEYYIAREQSEKARDLLLPLIAAAPSDFVARKRLADLYYSAGLASRALAGYEELERDFPQPIWVKRELAAAYEKIGLLDRAAALSESAFALNRDASNEQALVVRIEGKRRNVAALRRGYLAVAQFDPRNSTTAARLAALSANDGDKATAQRALVDAMANDPRNPALRQQFADLLTSSGNRSKADAELSRALLSNPSDDALRNRVQWHNTKDASPDPDLQYLARFENLKPGTPASSNVTALSDIRIDRMQHNGLYSSRVQQFFFIATQQDSRDFHSRNVQYAPASESLQILHARVHKPDGRILDADDAGEAPVAEVSVAMYYDVRSRALRFPMVEPGDIVELDYRTTPAAQTNPYGDYFGNLLMFRTTLPTAAKRYVLVTPSDRQIYVREVHMASPAVVTETEAERTYQWDATDVAALPNEPRGPAATSYAPYVHASTFANFQELGKWYAELLKPQLELDSTLREIAARIARENPDELARIHAIHQLVLRSTHYVALEFGVYSYKPYPVSQTYARRFGDCKDKASLMVALLRAVGVDADLAFVRTRRMGEIDENAASVAPFNHAIVYLPKYQLWLDGTAEYSGARELPLEDQGATALTVSANGDSVLRHIPVTTADDNYTHRTLRAELRRDGTIEFTGDTYTRGEDAPGLRREYEVPERQQDAVRQPLAELFPSVRLEKVEVRSANDLEQDVNVSFRGVLDSFAGKSTVVLNNSWMSRKYLSTLAALGTRSQDLLLPAPWSTQEEIRLALPAGAQAFPLPGDTRIDSEFGSAIFSYQQRGRDIVIRNFVQFRQLRITPAEYPAFRDFCSQVERAFRQEVKVSLR